MKKKYPRILLIAIFSLVTAFLWAASDIARSLFFKKPETKVSDEILAPIDPTLDKGTLDAVQNALYFDPNQVVTVNVTPSTSPEPQASPTLQPSPSASPSTIPEISPTPIENLQASPSP